MFLEPYASQHRLSEVIPELWDIQQRREAWDFYLHKVTSKTFSAFLKSIGEDNRRQMPSITNEHREEIKNVLKDQREIFSAFQRRQ